MREVGFIGVVLSVLILATDTILYRIIPFFKKNSFTSKLTRWVFWLIPILFITALLYMLSKTNQPGNHKQLFTFMWYVGALNLVYAPKATYIAVYFILKLINYRKHHKTLSVEDRGVNKITRASFMGKAGLTIASIPFFSLIYGLSKGRFNYFIKRTTLYSDNLPKSFDGLTIAQISDVHLGNYNQDFSKLEEVAELINLENPDILVCTGDLVNNYKSETEGWSPVFQKMNAKIGKYAVLGNHDYGDYSRWPSVKAKEANFKGIQNAYSDFGFKLLKNESINLVKGTDKISILGVENWGKPPFPQYGNLKDTLQNCSDAKFKVLLSHDPDHWKAEVTDKTDIDLTLSGHTHGMQLGVKFKNKQWSPAKWKFEHWDGLYKHKKQHLYVNRGIGFVGLPMRIGMPPEITIIELRKA